MTARSNRSKTFPFLLATALLLAATVPGLAGGRKWAMPLYPPMPAGLADIQGPSLGAAATWDVAPPVRTRIQPYALDSIAVPFPVPANLSLDSTELYATVDLDLRVPSRLFAVVTIVAREPGRPGRRIARARIPLLHAPRRLYGLAGPVHWEGALRDGNGEERRRARRLPLPLPASYRAANAAFTREPGNGELVRSWTCHLRGDEGNGRTGVCHFDLTWAYVREPIR